MNDHERQQMQRPEGRLLERALAATRPKLSARKAAEQIGISDSRLRHIIRGYQPLGRGQIVEVVAPADTLARIAYVLNVTAEDLARAGRKDAADAMGAAAEPTGVVAWPRDVQQRVQARIDAMEWFEAGCDGRAPRSLMRILADDDLLAELRRRLAAADVSDRPAGDPRRTVFGDPLGSIEDDQSGGRGQDAGRLAADRDRVPIEVQQELEPETP